MAIDEQRWRRAAQALANAVGDEAADALIARFLDEPARRDDLVAVEDRLDARISGVEERLDARISGVEERLDARISGVEERLDQKIDATRELLEVHIGEAKHEVIAAIRAETSSQFRSMLFGFVGLQATIGAFVIGLLRFGV
jgi:hypothetical protein